MIEVNKHLKSDVISIFDELFNIKFPIYSIIPIDVFDYSDEQSVLANNSSGYNYRYVKGTNRLSDHSKGIAIDINPIQNPWLDKNAFSLKRKYDIKEKGTITLDIVNIFKKYGWEWGGNWNIPDYQHFYKKMQ